MNIREKSEKVEEQLSKYASRSKKSKGRRSHEEKCSIRTEFQRDRDRIIHSKAFRRLKHKTQVFISPEGDHYRTRLTHTLEVSQIARTIGRALRLNEDLIEAIALGHDLGHTPFGHTGERLLNKINPKGFNHREQSLKVVDLLEVGKLKYLGLNLTYEVRDGILNHSGGKKPETLEGQVVRIADRIAYINHDIDDSIRAGILKLEDLPSEALEILGRGHGERINTMVLDLIKNSQDGIEMSDQVMYATNLLRSFLMENIYIDSLGKKEDGKAEYILKEMYNYYKSDINRIPKEHLALYENDEEIDTYVTDYLAGMTDRYLVNKFIETFVPKSWSETR